MTTNTTTKRRDYMKNKKVINIQDRIKSLKLEEDLDVIKLDIDMIEQLSGEVADEELIDAIVEFMKKRESIGAKFREWLNENIEGEDNFVFWSYITEDFQNLILPTIDDFSFEDGEILSKLDQSKHIAAALESFHVSSMKAYLDVKKEK